MADDPKTWVDLADRAVTVGLPILGTLGGIWLGSFLSQRTATRTAKAVAEVEAIKYRRDRLWDVRREIYTALIAKARELHETWASTQTEPDDWGVDFESYFSSADAQASMTQGIAQFTDLTKLAGSQRLVLTHQFYDHIEKLDEAYYAYARYDARHDFEDETEYLIERNKFYAKASRQACDGMLATAIAETDPDFIT